MIGLVLYDDNSLIHNAAEERYLAMSVKNAIAQ